MSRWGYDRLANLAFNDGRAEFHTVRPPLPTNLTAFIQTKWLPAYQATARPQPEPADLRSWLASRT